MIARIRSARESESGFTLIELLIVIVILGVLAGIVTFSVSGISDRGKSSACAATIKTVKVAGEAYYAKNNSYGTLALLTSAGFLQAPVTTDVNYVVTAATGANAASLAVTSAGTGSCAP